MRKFPFVVIGMLLWLPCAHAQSPLGWSVYRGEDGAIVDFPLGIFVQDAGPTAKGTGRRFKSNDGQSEFAIYTLREPGQTPGSYLRNNLAVAHASISYKRVTIDFLPFRVLVEGAFITVDATSTMRFTAFIWSILRARSSCGMESLLE